MPDYEHLHEAGYNVLCYDMRNFGHSGGIGSNGIFESRDVIGSLQYVTAREDLRDMTVGLFSRCCGGNATMIAMTNHPKYFKDHPVHGHPAAGLFASVLRAHHRNPRHHRSDRRHRPEIELIISFTMDQMSPIPYAKNVHVPTFITQVHDDALTKPSDVQ
jgi:uncharacterized protein